MTAPEKPRRSAPSLPPKRRYRVRPTDLRRLWAGQTVSMFGDEITAVALPTIALLTLNASPFQYGLLSASTYLPYPVLGLLAGAWVDRVRRRTVLLLADLVRGVAIASIPVAVITGTLTVPHLVLVGLVVGTASVFFNSAYQAFLPHVVATETLTKANARLSTSETASQVAGPSLAGLLISAIGVGGAMIMDAASFLVSVLSLLMIRRPEIAPERRRSSLIPDVRQGLRLVTRDRLLLGLTLTSAVSNLGRGMALQLVLLFAYSGLNLSPAVAGVMLAAGNVGPFLGSLASRRFTERFGLGPALLIGSVMKGLPWLLVPLALFGGAIPIIVAIMVVSGFFIPVSNVTTLTIRQTLVAAEMQGRVAATVRTVTRTAVPLATILGGGLGEFGTSLLGPRAGLSAVLALGGLIWMSAGVLLPRRVLRRVHSVDDLDELDPTVADRDPHRGRHRAAAANGRGGGDTPGAGRAAMPALSVGVNGPDRTDMPPLRSTDPTADGHLRVVRPLSQGQPSGPERFGAAEGVRRTGPDGVPAAQQPALQTDEAHARHLLPRIGRRTGPTGTPAAKRLRRAVTGLTVEHWEGTSEYWEVPPRLPGYAGLPEGEAESFRLLRRRATGSP